MAIITISRQVAALGDEIATRLAEQLQYTFIDRKMIEQRIIDLGFPQEKMEKYDERKPGFFASLAKDRDEYLDYLQTAILEVAAQGNCILIGRGSFVVLAELPNLFSIRLVAPENVRIARLMKEFDWDEKQALARIHESDENRLGFHKSFFDLSNTDPAQFHATLNTGLFSEKTAVDTIVQLCKNVVTADLEKEGSKKVAEMLEGQRLVNELIFTHKLNVNFLRAVVEGNTVTLQGVADSAVLAEQTLQEAAKILPTKKIESCITVVQDFKSFP